MEERRPLAELLGPDGPFAGRIDGYAPRSAQLAMAEAVERALDDCGRLIVEAGTGTGKTFAYLVPALRSGGKVIISTGTKALQDQLYHRDLPLVAETLGIPARTALLKGRSNYLCRHRLEVNAESGRFRSREMAFRFQRVREWSATTRSGDIAEIGDIPEDSPVWPYVTSTGDNCLGQECAHVGDCFLIRARRSAQEADLLVINHHLFFADMALRGEGFGELLPGANAVILDEAHQLPEAASAFFGLAVSGRQLLELAQDTLTEQVREAPDMAALARAAEGLEKAVRDLRLAFGEGERRAAWSEVDRDAGVGSALDALRTRLAAMAAVLEPIAERGKGLESCQRRSRELGEAIDQLAGDTPPGQVHWFETRGRGFTLHLTPLDVAAPLRAHMDAQKCAWVFTSATLAVGDSFRHFSARLGLEEAETLQLPSPFDYPSQALWYVPRGLPQPNTPGYTRAVVDAALPVLAASRGRAFLLFTSHRALREAADLLEGRLDYPLLVQGTAPRSELLRRFRELGNAVLLGTSSFWEGVDVRGDALSCVIIDKLPFAAPSDPVIKARIDTLREEGREPFIEFQVPSAVITLKQGTGRLIRDVSDRGVLMICDPRLLRRGYGHAFLDSLPPMARTRDVTDVERFFAVE
ncbi:MAG: ATP-dependent DNA helicase [Gammaproteobacteria bacterium]|nr:ATP-dependent DNA helicase [Gammaproteobacteria bacterium]